jgi:hypothetical protein
MRRRPNAPWAIALVLALTIGFGTYVRLSLRHMRLELPLAGLLSRVLPIAETVAVAAGGHGTCSSAVDYSSIGDREAEAEMSYVASMSDLYRSKFGSFPTRISELNKVPEFEHADSLNNYSFSRGCSIYVDAGGSFAVSCGQQRPPSTDIAAFMRTAPSAQNYYLVGKSEILYVPAPKC